jgi:hypothetical protein
MQVFGKALVCVMEGAAFTMCVDACGGFFAIGIEMKSPKCVERSGAGLVMESPGRKALPLLFYYVLALYRLIIYLFGLNEIIISFPSGTPHSLLRNQ